MTTLWLHEEPPLVPKMLLLLIRYLFLVRMQRIIRIVCLSLSGDPISRKVRGGRPARPVVAG